MGEPFRARCQVSVHPSATNVRWFGVRRSASVHSRMPGGVPFRHAGYTPVRRVATADRSTRPAATKGAQSCLRQRSVRPIVLALTLIAALLILTLTGVRRGRAVARGSNPRWSRRMHPGHPARTPSAGRPGRERPPGRRDPTGGGRYRRRRSRRDPGGLGLDFGPGRHIAVPRGRRWRHAHPIHPPPWRSIRCCRRIPPTSSARLCTSAAAPPARRLRGHLDGARFHLR